MTFAKLAPSIYAKDKKLERADFNLGFPYLYYSNIFATDSLFRRKSKEWFSDYWGLYGGKK